jgi:hypothetical protein
MIKKIPIVLVACTGLSAYVSNAAIYQSVDEQGNVVFSDEPTTNSEPVKLPPLPTYQPPKYQAPSQPDEGTPAAGVGYRQISVVSPAPDETLRDNTGNVSVKVAADPQLNAQAGHRFQYYLDGQVQGEPSASPQATFQNLDRGAHQVEVAVVNREGQELGRSSSVRFYLHRHSVNFPSGPPSVQPLPRKSPN